MQPQMRRFDCHLTSDNIQEFVHNYFVTPLLIFQISTNAHSKLNLLQSTTQSQSAIIMHLAYTQPSSITNATF